MLRKLRIQFVTVIMVIVTGMLCLIFGMLYTTTQRNLEFESIRMMQSIAINPFRLARPNDSPDRLLLPYFMLQIGEQGELTATGGGYYDLSDKAFLRELADAVDDTNEHIGLIKAYDLRFYRTISPNGERIVFSDISSERSTLQNLAKTCAVLGATCFVVFLGISSVLAFWMVKPVDRAWKQQRQFVADASHELKTPLTVIISNAEMLQSAEYNAESKVQFADSVLIMSRHMRQLVERLLDLARADNDQNKGAFSPLDFSTLTQQALLPFEPVFFEKGLTLSSSIQSGITVNGNGQQLNQLIDILLDNAQKYAAPQGEVTIRLEQVRRHHCRLSVANPGEVISPEDLKNIFKRFYRVDKARSRNGSFGLGLSIAESIVLSHRGKILAESKNGTNTFSVELPKAANRSCTKE